MARSVTQVRCPNCNSPIQAEIERVVDVSRDPSLKSRLLSGTLNHIHCPVCGYQGQLATPLVYHDADKELLLTHMPVEVGLKKDEQERLIGQLINQIVDRLPPEKRKAYLLQPQSVLTPQGMVERILEADGITREEIEGQRAKLRLFEELLRTPEENLETFIQEHDESINEGFLQLATLAIQSTENERARQGAIDRLEAALAHSSLGKRLQRQQEELRAAAESLQAEGDELTRERLLELIIDAGSEERVAALVQLTRPALDYGFFAQLSEKIDSAAGEERPRLEDLRSQVLSITEQIDQIQQAQINQAAALLRYLMEADDLEKALREALPSIDELFINLLQSNLQDARNRGNEIAASKLETIQQTLSDFVRRTMPAGLELAQRVVELEDEAQGKAILEAEAEKIDEDLLRTLIGASERLDEAGEKEGAQRLRNLHRYAVRQSMRLKMRERTA